MLDPAAIASELCFNSAGISKAGGASCGNCLLFGGSWLGATGTGLTKVCPCGGPPGPSSGKADLACLFKYGYGAKYAGAE